MGQVLKIILSTSGYSCDHKPSAMSKLYRHFENFQLPVRPTLSKVR